jgi:hypothetical protein
MWVLDPRFKLIDTMLQGGYISILMCKELQHTILSLSLHKLHYGVYTLVNVADFCLDQSIPDSKHYINLSHLTYCVNNMLGNE